MPIAQASAPTKPERASNELRAVVRHRMLLRGFIRGDKDGYFRGICLTLNLAVRGKSMEEAETKLRELILAYLEDASKSGHWEQSVPRRAPLSYYLEYYKLRALSQFRFSIVKFGFLLFVQSVPDCTAHA